MRRAVALTVLAVVLSVAPFAASQDAAGGGAGGASKVTFYGHIFGTGLNFPQPANTQFPWGEADFATSGPIDDTHCGPETPVGRTSRPDNNEALLVPCDEQHNTKLVLFTTAGPVTVKQARDFDYAKLHNEFGMTEDAILDTSQNVNATLYMTPASSHAWLHTPAQTPCFNGDPPENVPCLYPYWRWHAGVAPNFEVKAKLYAMTLGEHGANASTVPPIRAKLPEAVLIAEGQTQPETVISSDGYGDNPRVHRFDIDLGPPKVSTIDRNANLVLVFSWDQDLGGQEFMADTWRINSGEFFATSFSVPVKNAFMVERVEPAMVHEKVVIHSILNTPWGSYDVDPASVKLTVERVNGGVDTTSLTRVADFQVAHGAHYKAINVTWVWDAHADRAPAGEYVARVEGCNFQHSACDVQEATFRLLADGRLVDAVTGVDATELDDANAADNATTTPAAQRGVPLPLAALPFLAAGLLRRRRA